MNDRIADQNDFKLTHAELDAKYAPLERSRTGWRNRHAAREENGYAVGTPWVDGCPPPGVLGWFYDYEEQP